AEGNQRYAVFTNEQGGILDDLMITNAGDHLFVVVNAACKDQDIAHMRNGLGDDVELEVLDRALLALQGPAAAKVLARFAPDCSNMLFMDATSLSIDGAECFVSRSGYSGEDGYEISIPNDAAERIARLFLEQPEVEAIGLGARDSLRLEVGLCLYGHDLDSETTPIESSLLWALSKSRRADGERPGGYPGAEVIHRHQAQGVSRKRIGLRGQSRVPVREGAELVDAEGRIIGKVTSGSFGPTVGAPIAMGYLETGFAVVDTEVFAMVRGKPLAMAVAKMPFVPQRYYRG
ncbi:MAG: glycine cleavage system aminomethyltransferase GcvT, partial [Aestuariibacter sp.]|nr:glycine cleavage system aminomethyltransferase GcvT [Aestuariibacter sp.]